jgi:phosphoglycerate dehydrogenase-like enzyme
MANKLNIAYTRPMPAFGPLDPHLIDIIESVTPGIKVWDIADLVQAESKGDASAGRKLDAILAETEVIYGFPGPARLLSRAPRLKWIQCPLAGVDMFLTPEFIAHPVILTNGRGVGIRVAETALMLTLMLAKMIPVFDRYRKEKRWKKEIPDLLEGQTMGIMGLGVIGSEIAHLAKAFHMKVIATEIRRQRNSDIVDKYLPASRLPELLAKSDYVVSALPLTRNTFHTIGETQLKMMKPSAYLINISRGAIVDENALIRALRNKWIAGAGLDVFETEPLPPSSPLWDMENVVMTPHIAGQRKDYDLQITRLFCKNLRRFLSGQKLINRIDKEAGF